VSFSGAAFIDSMPTDDIATLREIVKRMKVKELGGTDLGSAIISSANILTSDRPKAIVLLTDGQSNIGFSPDDALEYIKDYKITIHTIGIGTSEGGLISDIGAAFKLDEESLKNIAAKTGGQYFRPVDEQSLRDTFVQIAQFKEQEVSKDISLYLLLIALVILMVEWGLIGTKYKIL
jgi:Ca-activated chloride channel family protein